MFVSLNLCPTITSFTTKFSIFCASCPGGWAAYHKDQLCRLEPWTGPGGPWQMPVTMSVFFLVWNFLAKKRTNKFKRGSLIGKYRRNILDMEECAAFGAVVFYKALAEVFLTGLYSNNLPARHAFWIYNIYKFIFIIVYVFCVIFRISVSLQEMSPTKLMKSDPTNFFITFPPNLEPRRPNERNQETITRHKYIYFPKTTKQLDILTKKTMTYQDIVHHRSSLVIVDN